MALPLTRHEFKQYILRELGEPVIEINITDDQLDQVIDKCLHRFQEEHFNGSERVYFPYKLSQQDIERQYLDVSAIDLIGVLGIFPFGSQTTGTSLLSADFIVKSDAVWAAFKGGNLSYYTSIMEYRSTIDYIVSSTDGIRYTKTQEKVFIDTDWSKFSVDDYIIIDCYIALNPDFYPKMWEDDWLRDYVRWSAQLQWGQNLIKFTGVELPGGMVLNGEKIYEEAKAKLQEMHDKLLSEAQLPPDFMIG